MNIHGFNSIQFRFCNSENKENSFLSAAITILLTTKSFVDELYALQLSCKGKNHKCISCSLKSLLKEDSIILQSNIISLIAQLKDLLNEKGLFVPNNPNNLSDAISSILKALHCKYLANDSDGLDEEIVNMTCYEKCPLHKVFYLGVEENHVCRCGSSEKFVWEYDNICQNFVFDETLWNIDKEVSNKLIGIPDFKFKTEFFYTNSIDRQGKIAEILIENLRKIEANECLNQNCYINKSKLLFSVTNYPEVYIINLIWPDYDPSHLESLISTISIAPSIRLSQIYGKGTDYAYNLKGIALQGKGYYEYAYRFNDSWIFPGLDIKNSWYDLVKHITIVKFHPIIIVYEKGTEEYSMDIERYKLTKLEKIAAQCDLYEEKLMTDVVASHQEYIDLCGSGYHSKKKLDQADPEDSKKDFNTPDYWVDAVMDTPGNYDIDRYQDRPIIPQTNVNMHESGLQVAPKLSNQLEKNYKNFGVVEKKKIPPPVLGRTQNSEYKKNEWVCACKTSNLDDWEICKSCDGLKPGLEGWVCKFCKYRNEKTYTLSCELCEKHQDDWKCMNCEYINMYEISYCSRCQHEKEINLPEPVLTGWVCEFCGFGNTKDSLTICKSCKNWKDNWRCKSCREINSFTLTECRNCSEKNQKLSILQDWICEKCKNSNKHDSKVCENCTKTSTSKNSITKKDLPTNKWVCSACTLENDEWKSFCEACDSYKQEEKKIESQTSWKCLNCSKDNEKNLTVCFYCNTYNSNAPNKSKDCDKCFRKIEKLFCVYCNKNSPFQSHCFYCNKRFVITNKCSECLKR
jgi:hypothetical protein